MNKRGWSSEGLDLVGEDDCLWTVEDAARFLGSPVTVPQVRYLITLRQLEPVGVRRPVRAEARGRAARVYRAVELIKAYDNLTRAA